MRELYQNVFQALKNISFNELWPGFSSFTFALYNDEEIYLEDRVIPYDASFIGNTSILYNGEFIAIWKVEHPEQENPLILASNIVHEMFHAFQYDNQETRFPNNLVMLDYPNSLENYQLKSQENKILVQAYKEKGKHKKSELFQKFVAIRKKREALIGEMIHCEYLTETTEGMAEYVGTKALSYLAPELFEERMEKYLNILSNPSVTFFDIRRMSYYTGTVLCLVLDDLGSLFVHPIGETTETVFELAEKQIETHDLAYVEMNADQQLEEVYQQYLNSKIHAFDDFFKKPHSKTEGSYQICGYDPMNMLKKDNQILCTHFIMLNDESDHKRFIKGPVVVELTPGATDQVITYYQLT
ncbi:MAG TPA: hypothetical protein VNM69_22745 [Bacillus sp. (in: firmicutes)]|uniref:hypothetical protein n=1 Tax=Bacillus litorisediminis TaxID=2922713 RepID=UPI001FABE07E|nr:hypothetical protein [Bacillus litorisediminis]HWO78686.1 hypothetical protein [Bacillus sp. (in: firmicutes)]